MVSNRQSYDACENLHAQGFIRFKRGLGGFGQCSIAHEPAYAIKTHPNPPPRDVALTLAAADAGSGHAAEA